MTDERKREVCHSCGGTRIRGGYACEACDGTGWAKTFVFLGVGVGAVRIGELPPPSDKPPLPFERYPAGEHDE